MLVMLARNWWVFLLRGLVAVIFGVLAIVWPEITLLTLIALFGVYALVDGIFAIVAGISSYGEHERWWAILLAGLAGILFGGLTLFWPRVTATVLVYFIAAWAVVTGIFTVLGAIQLRRVIRGEGWLILSGILSIVFGIFLFVYPGASALGMVLLIGAYAIVFGIIEIILAFRLRRLGKEIEKTFP